MAKKAPSKPRATGSMTTITKASTATFFASLDATTRADCEKLDAWMKRATGAAGVMYGKAIVGYGTKSIRYADGREAPWLRIGFAPRSDALAIYGLLGSAPAELLQSLGKHKTGKGCLYVKRLSDVSGPVLEKLIQLAAQR
jgi:hypothetical protein